MMLSMVALEMTILKVETVTIASLEAWEMTKLLEVRVTTL